MKCRCPLCKQLVPPAAQNWCTCGAAMDPRCWDAHRSWCATESDERWIGAHEF